MISFDFRYYHPSSLNEAIDTFKKCTSAGMDPIYYAGGTEIITFARKNELFTHAVIDIKGIPECRELEYQNDLLVFGAGLTLTQIIEAGPFPLLSASCRHVADHTNRNKITLGGNICGRINYREALLPFLLTDSRVVTIGKGGLREADIHDIYNQEVKLDQGEFLVQLAVERQDTRLPFVSIKRTKQEKVDYPLVSLAAIKKDGSLRFAFSGVCTFPFRSKQMEEALNNQSLSIDERVNYALTFLPDTILDDILGSREYRAFVLQDLLIETLAAFEGV